MLIKKPSDIKPSEITDKSLFATRRQFMRLTASATAALAEVIKRFEPISRAKYVEFTTLHNPEQMPGQHRSVLPWPYLEGLRMDEAMHPLTILAIGLYGEVLPNKNGAPLRLVVPWKYGFKSIQCIVKEIVKRPYITVGFSAFVLLIPLALTSTNGMIRRLGGERWKRLHSMVYVIGTLGIFHFLWLVKADTREPVLYGTLLTLLLATRMKSFPRLALLRRLTAQPSCPEGAMPS